MAMPVPIPDARLAERRLRRKQLFAEREQQAKYQASAKRIRAIRAALEMTQRDFAYYVRVATGAVSDWETGKTMPSPLAEQSIRTVAATHGLDLHTMQRFKSFRED